MKAIEITDLSQYQMPSSLAFSEDGKFGVFRVSQADLDDNSYHSNLWVLETESGTVRQLTNGNKERAFAFNGPHSVLIPALRTEADQKKAQEGQQLTVFYEVNLLDGEAKELFRVPLSGATAKRLEAGLYLITASFDNNKPDFSQLKGEELAAAKKAWAEEKDYQIVDELPFWFNGRGFINKKRSRLYLYQVSDKSLKAITQPLFDTAGAQYCRDLRAVIYSGVTFDGLMDLGKGLYLYSIDSGETRCILPENRYTIRNFCLDNEGRRVIFGGSPLRGRPPVPGNSIFAVSLEGGAVTPLLQPLPEDLGLSTCCDVRYGGGQTMTFRNETLYLLTSYDNSSGICALRDGDTQLQHITPPDLSVDFFAFAGERLYAACLKDTRPLELFSIDLNTGSADRVSHFNDACLEDKYIARPQPLSYINKDGLRIDGFVLLPMDFDPAKQYGGVLEIHGGPRNSYSDAFIHEMQVMAGAGYFVFYCNPRGSAGRGEDFANIYGKYGTIDYEDIMGFTDTVLATYPQLDPERLTVAGGSYGGFMTNWIIGHTDRFKAAASQRSIANWLSQFGVSDVGERYCAREIAATPWTAPEAMWRASPLAAADKVKTPTLFINSDEDYRCWMSEGIQMYVALILRGIPTRMCIFHGENHELSRSGKPKHRIRRLTEITSWLYRYMSA